MTIGDLWDRINTSIQQEDVWGLEGILRQLELMDSTHSSTSEFCFAAGYASYMLPSGHPMRGDAELWFLQALISQPGHTESILYLSYILIDMKEWQKSLALLFAVVPEISKSDVYLMDRLVEARVVVLSKIGNWSRAMTQLDWFDRRMDIDPDCGLPLINFMNLLDDHDESDPISIKVINKIRLIVQS